MTRKSSASLAWITRRNRVDAEECLVQWNSGWQAFSLIGGHVESGESYLEACCREIEEELECSRSEFRIAEHQRIHLHFEGMSKSANELTEYDWQLFFVSPSENLLRRLPSNCTWVTSEEIRAQRTSLGQAIDRQVLRVLDATISSDWMAGSASSIGSVTWTSAARQDLPPELIRQVNLELLTIYPGSEVIVKQRFSGYQNRPNDKLIMAIEVCMDGRTQSNVIKLGSKKEVGGDSEGWNVCATRRGVNSRLFIAPTSYDLPHERILVVYPDVYQYYFDNGQETEPSEFEDVVKGSVQLGVPSADSIERVLTQVYSEAHRCFYHNAVEQNNSSAIRNGLHAALHPDNKLPVFELWRQDEYSKLRRGAAWLTCGDRKPEATKRPAYIDPVDYLAWAFEQNALPPMLVGPAHGDLHARNIIVGQVRGEVEWPAVIDFDKMSVNNIVALDFAKLEVELKCRLFQYLLETPEQRQHVCRTLQMPELPPLPDWIRKSPENRIAQRADRMRVMFAIEQRLAAWTNELSSYSQATGRDNELLFDLDPKSDVGRGLRIIFRIRREAAVYLGHQRQGRESRWRDEYNFALMSYGVIAAKWHSPSDILMWALISSGVAAAQLSQLPWPPNADIEPEVQDQPTYLHIMPWSAKSWAKGGGDATIAVLREAAERFPYATAVVQQLALLLAQSSSDAAEEEARRTITDISNLAVVFRDHETICRLGRVYKDRGDRCFLPHHTLEQVIADKLPMVQVYQSAFKYYHLATEVSDYNYYPCVNAATLALLTGQKQLQESLASKVLEQCGAMSTDREDRLWILASEGEASLLLGRVENAIDFYRQTLARILPSEHGLLQSIYDQLCRLHWALGPTTVGPIVSLIQAADPNHQLKPGPFGDCR